MSQQKAGNEGLTPVGIYLPTLSWAYYTCFITLDCSSVGVDEDGVYVEGSDGRSVAFGAVAIDKMEAIQRGFYRTVSGQIGVDFDISV